VCQSTFDNDFISLKIISQAVILHLYLLSLNVLQYPTQEWTTGAWKGLEGLRRRENIVDLQWVSYNSKVTTFCITSPINRGIFAFLPYWKVCLPNSNSQLAFCNLDAA